MTHLARGSMGAAAVVSRHRATAAAMRALGAEAERFGPVRKALIQAAAAVGVLLAVAAWAGWWLDVPALRSLGGGRWQMNPVTALGHLVLAGILWWRSVGRRARPLEAVVRRAGPVLVGVGAYQVLALWTGWVPRLDQYLFREPVLVAIRRGGAGVSIETGVSFALVGLGLALAGRGKGSLRGVAPWEGPVLLAGLIAFFSLVRYAYASNPWTDEMAAYFPMAPNTAFAFLASSIGLLAALPDGVVAARFGGASVSSAVLRRLVAGAVLVLAVGGALEIEAERRGLMGSTFGTSLLVTVGVILVGVLLWRQTARLEAAEVDLRSALTDRVTSELLSRALFELAPDALLLVDGSGRIVRANDEMEVLTGYRSEELEEQNVELLVPERFRAAHPGLRREFMKHPQRRSMGEGRELAVRRADGEEILAEIALAPLGGRGDHMVMVAFKDMTHRVLMRRDLEQRTRLLENTNRELEAFSYSVSHDLRAPLRAIHGFSQILEEDFSGDLPQEARRYLSLIRASSAKMGRLIDDLLSFAHLSRAQLHREDVCLEDLVRSCFEEVSRPLTGDAPSASAARCAELVIGDLPVCRADPALLKQAMVNLLANAVKFSRHEEHPVVEVGCTDDPGSEQVFFVRDNGVGFDSRYANKLFGVFQRLHREEEFEGTGVGLALVQRILHRHGGRIWAESAPGDGATFFFTLGDGEPEA